MIVCQRLAPVFAALFIWQRSNISDGVLLRLRSSAKAVPPGAVVVNLCFVLNFLTKSVIVSVYELCASGGVFCSFSLQRVSSVLSYIFSTVCD